jgi:hypothetical protein
LLWVGGVAAVVVILRRESPEYAEMVDPADAADPDQEEPAAEPADHDPTPTGPDAEEHEQETTDEAEVAVDDDAPEEDEAPGDDSSVPVANDSDEPDPVRPEPEPPARKSRGGLFGRRRSARAPEPPAPPRPRTVADLVAERARAAAEQAAAAPDDE